MDERHRSDSRDILQSRGGDSDTDDIDLSPIHESGMTQTFEGATRERGGAAPRPIVETEADIILIAHPESQRLGSRFRLSPGTTLEIGRSAAVRHQPAGGDVDLPQARPPALHRRRW